MYSRLYGLSVIAARLGWVVRGETELERMRALPLGTRFFLGINDVKEFFLRCLLAPNDLRFAVVYAVSKQSGSEVFDMEPARRILGFEVKDELPGGLTSCR
jgi:hypothetical protein